MWAVLALGTAETLINQWIDLDAATRQQLNVLAGKLLRVVIGSPQLSVDVWFDQDKIRLSPTPLGGSGRTAAIFEQRPYDPACAPEQATTTLQVNNLVELGKLITAKAGETGNIPLQGEMSLLQQLQRILAQAQPDLASRLSPWIGAIAAGQLGQALQDTRHLFHRTGASVLHHAEDALIEDSQLFVTGWQMAQLSSQTRQLRHDVERAQARLQAIQAQLQRQLAVQNPVQPLQDQQAQQQ